MCKIKKSMAVLLSALMLASFMPLFASAAIAVRPTTCTLVEAPKLSYKGGEATSNLVVPGGATKADITIVGGKITYEGAVVEGCFSWTSSATATPSTAVLSVGDVPVALYFLPTDTATYRRSAWSNTATNPLEGWPTLAVDGIDCSIVDAPTVSGDLLSGKALNTLTLSGGKVTDADGNDITANGTWSFVYATSKPTESGEQQVQWKCEGYDVPKTTVNVTVKIIQTTLVSGPEPKFVRTSAFIFASTSNIYLKDGSGKILDEDGNDVTANGKWVVTETMPDTIIMKDTEVSVKWSATGYAPVETKMVVTVSPQYASNLKITKNPTFDIPETSIPWEEKYYSDVATLVPGEIVDESGNKVEGTWTYTVPGYTTLTPDKVSLAMGTKVLTPKFVPADTSLPEITGFSVSNNKVTVVKADFALIEGFEVVLNYGASFSGALLEKDLKFSTVGTVPEKAGVYKISWSKDVFDPSTADYGSVTYVEATIESNFGNIFNNQTVTIPVRIQPYTIAGVFTSWTSVGAYSRDTDNTKGIINYSVNFTNTRLFGNVEISVTDGTDTWVVDTVTPIINESGVSVYNKQGTWQAPCDGEYYFTYTYIPSENDTAVAENNVMANSEPVVIDMKVERTITINIGSETITKKVPEGLTFADYWAQMTKTPLENFDHWEFFDADGNAFTPEGADIYDENLSFSVPEHDVTVVAKTADGGEVENDTFSLWSFWQKLINFIIEIYTQIMNVFVPSVEQGW